MVLNRSRVSTPHFGKRQFNGANRQRRLWNFDVGLELEQRRIKRRVKIGIWELGLGARGWGAAANVTIAQLWRDRKIPARTHCPLPPLIFWSWRNSFPPGSGSSLAVHSFAPRNCCLHLPRKTPRPPWVSSLAGMNVLPRFAPPPLPPMVSDVYLKCSLARWLLSK